MNPCAKTLTSCIIALSGSLMLSSMQEAKAERGDGSNGFRAFREQNPELSRLAARKTFSGERKDTSFKEMRTLMRAERSITSGRDAALLRVTTQNNYIDRTRNQSVQITSAGAVRLSQGVDLDLNSQNRNITLGSNIFPEGTESVVISTGGETRTVNAGSQVTAAEFVAVKQVLSGGVQKLNVGHDGKAIGGEVDLAALTSEGDLMRASELVVPSKVTAFGDFAKRSDFRLLGDLDNFGTIQTVSSNNSKSGLFQADSINNRSGASIVSAVDLTIEAKGNLTNDGVISSTQGLTLSAAGQINNSGEISAEKSLKFNSNGISNSGLIESKTADVNFDGLDTALTINNHGGTVAANGAINLRASSYSGTGDSSIYGGSLNAKDLNLNSGLGFANVHVDDLTAMVNETGLAAHVSADTDVLNIGNVCLTGDPTFYNTGGSININSDLTVAEDLVIVASGDITSAAGITITAGTATEGQPITLIAGADFTVSGGANSPTLPAAPANAGAVSLSGEGSTAGGKIAMGAATTITTRNTDSAQAGSAGNVYMYAFVGETAGSGVIDLGGSTILTGGRSGGDSGDIELYAGAQSGNAIVIGEIDTTGGAVQTGLLFALVSQPESSVKGVRVEYDQFGVRTSTARLVEAEPDIFNNGNILVQGPVNLNINANLLTAGAIEIQDSFNAGNGVLIEGSDIICGPSGSVTFSGTGFLFADNNIGSDANPLVIQGDEIRFSTGAGNAFVRVTNTGNVEINNVRGVAGETYRLDAANATLKGALRGGGDTNLIVDAFSIDESDLLIEDVGGVDLTIGDDLENFAFGGLNSLVIRSAGKIGTAANPLVVAGPIGNVVLDATTDIFLSQTNTQNSGSLDLTAGGDVEVVAAGSMLVEHAKAGNRVFMTVEGSGTLTVGGDIEAVNSINLETSGTNKKSKINFLANSSLTTTAKTAGLGDIYISVGPTKSENPNPQVNIDEVEIGPGVVTFLGSRVSSAKKAPVNTLTAQGANVTINNGFKKKNITFGGGVTMLADPPVDAGALTHIVHGPTKGADNKLLDVLQTTPLTSDPAQSLLSASTHPAFELNLELCANAYSNAIKRPMFKPYDSYIEVSQPTSYEHDALLCSDQLLSSGSIESSAGHKQPVAFKEQFDLENGSMVFYPSKDMTVSAGAATIHIAGGSVALVSVGEMKVSVYDLHDSQRDGIVVQIDGVERSLSPGQHLTATIDRIQSFSEVNPIEAIGHRTLSRQTLPTGKCLFSSEFAIPHALSAVNPIKTLLSTNGSEARKVALKLIKTAAVLIHLRDSAQPFEYHVTPKTVALNFAQDRSQSD